MHIQIDGQGITVSPALKELTQKKMERKLSHFEKINNIHVILKVSKIRQEASAHLAVPGAVINAHVESEDMYKTIDLLVKNLYSQLTNYKEKHEAH
jgi:putative sigma-54 modulation protein